MQSPGQQPHLQGAPSQGSTELASGAGLGPSWSGSLISGGGAGEEHSHPAVPGRGPRHACTSSAHHKSTLLL